MEAALLVLMGHRRNFLWQKSLPPNKIYNVHLKEKLIFAIYIFNDKHFCKKVKNMYTGVHIYSCRIHTDNKNIHF